MTMASAIEEKIWEADENGKLIQLATDMNTHVNRHEKVTDSALMQRVFDEVDACSAFYDNIPIEQVLTDAICYHAKEISDWTDMASYRETQHFDVRLDPDDYGGRIGYGEVIDKKTNCIKDYDTSAVRVVLQKDSLMPLGFSILTAYPILNDPDIKPTGKDLRPAMRKTAEYEAATPVKKAYMEYRANPKSDMLITYKKGDVPEDDLIQLYTPTGNPNSKNVIMIKESAMILYTITETDGVREPVPSKYTQLRDQVYEGKTFYNQKCNLLHPELHQEFFKDHPQITAIADGIRKTVRSNIPTERQTTFRSRFGRDKLPIDRKASLERLDARLADNNQTNQTAMELS